MRKAWINENKTRFRIIREQKSKVFDKRKKPMPKRRALPKEMVIDPDEYDPTLVKYIHGDPVRNPPDSLTHYKTKEQYNAIPEAFRLNFMNKDDPENHTKYVNALTDYWKVIGKDEQFIKQELQKLRDDGIKFKDNT